MTNKYEPLEIHLRECGLADLPMTFAEIEETIGAALPASAFRHRAWWSNNPNNSVVTDAWLKAGYKSADVDMADRKLVFRKSAAGGRGTAPDGTDAAAAGPPRPSIVSRIRDALEGTVTVQPGTDLTQPADAEWEAAR